LGTVVAAIERLRGRRPTDEILKSLQIVKLTHELSSLSDKVVDEQLTKINSERETEEQKTKEHFVFSRFLFAFPSTLLLVISILLKRQQLSTTT
jgi:hypothetical protein